MKFRERKADDQEKTEKALHLLLTLVRANQKEIDPTLWAGAMIAALADNYEKSGIPFKCFKQEMKECVNHYRYGSKKD